MPEVQVTVPDSGHVVGDGDRLVRLRAAAEAVGSSSYEIEDDDGTLAILLHFPPSAVDDAKEAARRFAELAGFSAAVVRAPVR